MAIVMIPSMNNPLIFKCLSNYSVPAENVKPHIEALLTNLFAALGMEGSEENEYIMKGE